MTSPSSMTAPKQSKVLSTSTTLPKWWGYGSSPSKTWTLPPRQLIRLRMKSAEVLALRAVPLPVRNLQCGPDERFRSRPKAAFMRHRSGRLRSTAARLGKCALRTAGDSKSLTTTACGAFFDVAAATASAAHPFVNAGVSVLSPRVFFNAVYAGLGTLPDGPQMKSYERSSAQLHGRPGGNAGSQLKTWSRTIQEDLALLGRPRVYDLRRWNRKWPVSCTEMAQDRRAWSVIVRDAVNTLEAGQFRRLSDSE